MSLSSEKQQDVVQIFTVYIVFVHYRKVDAFYTVPKTRQISEKIREEVPWKENSPVIRGNYDYFPRITGNFSYRGLPPLYLRKAARYLGQCTWTY
jgi:hypothetical protein